MHVEARLLLTFKKGVPGDGQPLRLELAPGSTVAQAIAALPLPPDARKVVLLNGRLAVDAQVLKDGDVLTVFPPLEGG